MVEVTNREYYPAFTSGSIDWLLGNVGHWQRLRVIFRVSIDFVGSLQDSISFEQANKIILMNGKTWSEYGFDIGMTFTYRHTSGTTGGSSSTLTQTRTITNISGDTLTYSGAVIFNGAGTAYGSDIVPGARGNYYVKNVLLYVNQRPQGIEIEYNHMTNDNADSLQMTSFIDGNKTRFSVSGTDTMSPASTLTMNAIGLQSGMAVHSCTVGYFGPVGAYTYNYYVDIVYSISSYFEQASNLLAPLTAPSQNYDASSLTDNFSIKAFPEWNNPNTAIKNDLAQTKRLGNTGWYYENFNGLPNQFAVDSVVLKNSSNFVVQQVDYTQPTKVRAVISGFTSIHPSNSKFKYGFIYVPNDESQYKNKTTPFHQNVMLSDGGALTNAWFTLGTYGGMYLGYGNDGVRMDVTDVEIVQLSGLRIQIDFTLVPTAGFTDYMSNQNSDNRNCFVWVSVDDPITNTAFSKRVELPLYAGGMEKTIQPVGEYPYMGIAFHDHPEDGTEIGECKYIGFAEDDVLSKSNLLIDTATTTVKNIEIGHELVQLSTGNVYDLGTVSRNVSAIPVVGGIQQINIDESRSFQYASGFNKNWLKIVRNEMVDGLYGPTFVGYSIYYGWKARWEDWLSRSGVPNDFYNTLMPSNGFNNDWVRYSRESTDYQLQFVIYTTVIENGEEKRYRNARVVKLSSYDENQWFITDWDFTKESDNSSLNITVDPETGRPRGMLPTGENVNVAVKFRLMNGNSLTAGQLYATMNIQERNGSGQIEHRQLSSLFYSETGCPLVSIDNSGLLKITQIDPITVLVEGKINQAYLSNGNNFQITCKLGWI